VYAKALPAGSTAAQGARAKLGGLGDRQLDEF
jgi:hypothetical protein